MTTPLALTLLLLLSAVLGVVVFRALNLPPMLGYLCAGVIIGPHVGALVANPQSIEDLAEFGIVFLMFSLGLEFSRSQLRAMKRVVFGLGFLQVALSIAVAVLISLTVHAFMPSVSWQTGLIFGSILAMSSTAIVSKMLTERVELGTAHGRNMIGVLLFQDLAVVPLLIIIAALTREPSDMAVELSLAALKAAVVLALLLFVGRRVMGKWLDLIARRHSQELFMLNLLLLTLGAAALTHHFGLSMALGAFMTGMLIAETPYHHQVEGDIRPLRDVLLGLFFMTTGMLLDPAVLLQHPLLVVLLLLGMVFFKLALVFGLARLFGASSGVAIRTSLGLAQAGEFGFVLLNFVSQSHLIDAAWVQVVLAAMLLSMLAAPFLIIHADRIALWLSSTEWLNQSLQMTQIAAQSIKNAGHVVICGYGRSGQNLARMLEQEGLSYVALDLEPDRVNAAAVAGESVVYGDAMRSDVLAAAGIQRAAAVAITIGNTRVALKILHTIHALAPALPVIVRTADDSDLEKFLAAGAAEVIPESIEGSLMLASHTLVLMGVPMRRVLRRIEEMRDARYTLLRGYFRGTDDSGDNLDDHEQARLQSIFLAEGAAAIGASLHQLGLESLGAEVTAIRRQGIRGVAPGPETQLRAGDIVVVRGRPEALAQAEEVLLARGAVRG